MLSPALLISAVAAALAVSLLVPGRFSAAGVPASARSRWWLVWPPMAIGLAAAAGLAPTLVVLAGVVLGVVAGATRLWRTRVLARRRTETEGRVLETCDHLAGELATGRPPGAALDRAALAWPVLAPVAEAFRVGSDVPAALRSVAETPGAADLRRLAAAWQVAHRTGEGLGDAVDRVAAGLRATHSTRRVVQGELASARATARLIGLLPPLALVMGSGAGGDPWHFLLRTPAGLACLAAGAAIGLVGLAWIEAIARSVEATS